MAHNTHYEKDTQDLYIEKLWLKSIRNIFTSLTVPRKSIVAERFYIG